MNKEAKAIVEYLEEEREAIRTLCYYPDDVLNCEDLIKVMDYINQLETNIDKAIEYLECALDEEKETPSKHNDWRLDLLEMLERGKE